jgi:DNA helicase IV
LNKNQDSKLFCIGDDRQSVMGFAGSNVDYFIEFEKQFDRPEKTYLTVNYRSTKPIVDVGATIIQYNKSKLDKETKAIRPTGKPITVYLISAKKFDYYDKMVEHCVKSIAGRLQTGECKPNDIMILMRIKNNVPIQKKFKEKFEEYSKNPEFTKLIDIERMSVHQSKGLQAKVVYIINVNDELYGFPCHIEDPKIFEPAIDGRKKDRL